MTFFRDEYPWDHELEEEAKVDSNLSKARDWSVSNIQNRKIRMLVKAVINATSEYGVWIYHVSKFDSVYLKFKNQKMGSVRIADHESRKTHLNYTWNILLDCGNIPKGGRIVGNMHFYKAGYMSDFFKDLKDRRESINQKPMNFSALIGNKNKVEFKTEENKTGEQGMKTKNIAAVLMNNCKTIGVRFAEGDKTYTYKTTEDFKVGEYAVVNTPRHYIQGQHSGLAIVIVSEVHKVPNIDVDSNINYQWIVQKVDMENYISLNTREDEFNDHLLEVQQASVKKNAVNMLAEHLGTGLEDLQKSIELLNGGVDE